VRRLLVAVPLAIAALAPVAPAHAALTCVPGPVSQVVNAGVCAGIVCVDLCGPTVVVDPYCHHLAVDNLDALCAAVDGIRWNS
jgi:hypothetical protein